MLHKSNVVLALVLPPASPPAIRASAMRLKSLAICLRGWREKEKSYVASDELVAYLARSPTSSQSLTSLPLLSVLPCCALFFFFKFLIASDFQLLIADALNVSSLQ